MERRNNNKILVIVVLIVMVVGLTVAFSAMSTTLKINSTAKIKASTWNIRFDNLSVDVTGKAEANDEDNSITNSTNKVVMTNTNISGIEVTLKEPGDKVVYSFDVVNDGDINATLSSLTKSSNLSCKYVDTSKASDDALTSACNAISYKLTYGSEDGDEVVENDSNLDLIKTDNSGSSPVLDNDQVRMYLTIEFDENAAVLPEDDIILTDSSKDDIEIDIVYSQK